MTEQPALDFAGLLRQLRVEARLTQEELAEAAGLSPRTVSDLERRVNRIAAVSRQLGDHDQAAGYDQEALALYQEIGDLGGETEALNGAGETLLATGQPAQAGDRHTAALALADRTGDRYQQARAHRGLAEACHCVGQPDQAREHGQLALDIYTDLGVPEAASVPTSSPAAVIPAGRAPAQSRGGST